MRHEDGSGGHHGSENGNGNGSGPGIGAPPPGNGGTKCLSGTCSSPSCLSSLSSLASCAGHAAVSTVTSTIHQGAQCLFHGNVVACVETAANVAVAVGTGGTGGTGDAAVGFLEQAREDDAAQEGDTALLKAAEACLGGESFTASTKVLLANGKTVPISQLEPGDKVLATNTKTGKTQPETITAILVHHDTDLYDLKISDGGRSAVSTPPATTCSGIPGTGGNTGRWVKAGSLKHGTHLRTASGGTATVLGGWTLKETADWMWDLTIPGNNDHDF